MIKNSHIYNLNHNLKSLKRKESVDELYKFRIGKNHYINNREEPLKHKMIDGIDDVMSLKDEEYILVLKGNDLNKAIYERKRAGYEPQVRHTGGRAVEIKFDSTHNKIVKKQKTVIYSSVTQHRDDDRINDDILVETEE